jgi:tetratricopeptide (TPR) repeat protein
MSSFAAPPADDNRLKAGTRVTLIGLKAESMNGLVGTVLCLDGERYVVRLDADDKSIKVKPCNLIATRSDNSHLKQLHVEADALTNEGRHKQAYLLYQQVYEGLAVTHGEYHQGPLLIMFNMGLSLMNQQRYVEAHCMLKKVLPKFSSAFGCEDPLTLLTMCCLAEALYRLERYDESLGLLEIVLPKQEQIRGEDENAIATMRFMAYAQFELGRFDDAHRTASRGLLLARKVGDNDEVATHLVNLLSDLEQVGGGGGGKGEQKKKSSKAAGGAAESGDGNVKACAVCMSTVKTKACSGCKQVFYVSWMPSTPTPMSDLSNPSLSPSTPLAQCGEACQLKHWKEHKAACKSSQKKKGSIS